MRGIAVYCADVGSIARGNFGWARRSLAGDEAVEQEGGADIIRAFADAIVGDVRQGIPVALGFEAPLFVPVPDDPSGLIRGRDGEGNRPWNAGAGTGALCCGLVEAAWVLRCVRQDLGSLSATCDWTAFHDGRAQVFLWEALITGEGKAMSHAGDARLAVDRFIAALPDLPAASAVTAERPFSLIGSAAGYAEVSVIDPAVLQSACVVVRA